MFLGLLNKQPVLDEASSLWMFDTFAWALRNLDATVFFHETPLVTPSNEHFPGSVNSPHGMAALIFERVQQYAGVQHWPCRVVDETQGNAEPVAQLPFQDAQRGVKTGLPRVEGEALKVFYHPDQLRDPQVLIAHYAHTLAHYLGSQAGEAPPGGMENWPHVTELLAVFLGFGLMMANTAFTQKIRSCSSCSGPAVERSNFLSQYDVTYALAIFAAAKGIPTQHVLAHLKKTLRPFYKKAAKEVAAKSDELQRLLAYRDAVPGLKA